MSKSKIITLLLITNVVAIITGGYFYSEYQGNNAINDDVQRSLALELRKVRGKYNNLSDEFDESEEIWIRTQKEFETLKAKTIEELTLEKELDMICGDTWCEGDFNLENIIATHIPGTILYKLDMIHTYSNENGDHDLEYSCNVTIGVIKFDMQWENFLNDCIDPMETKFRKLLSEAK